ncbi:S-phase kinase-associated protein 1 [Pseudolycoriella hygida]|uniref:S-phase kinase-associated protein 1 n=1 Tax=Pseudolycoriella hygida TaxID=35572 RepID=A0A9Q0S3G0_9DIPT|nr:S-phase kinase-associated protein 1 [Pseudolycoriella hygida]
MSNMIYLQSSDGDIFETDAQIAKCSGTIRFMLEDCYMGEYEGVLIPLPNVNSAILRKVLKWADHHKDDPVPIEDDGHSVKQVSVFSSWDAEFLEVDQGTLFGLVQAANYLDIQGLLDVTCKTVANKISGKTADDIRNTLTTNQNKFQDFI